VLLLEAVLLFLYQDTSRAAFLALVRFVIVMCHGPGHQITPTFAADYCGPQNVGPIFGLMLLPWAFAAAFGPPLFAYLCQTMGDSPSPASDRSNAWGADDPYCAGIPTARRQGKRQTNQQGRMGDEPAMAASSLAFVRARHSGTVA